MFLGEERITVCSIFSDTSLSEMYFVFLEHAMARFTALQDERR